MSPNIILYSYSSTHNIRPYTSIYRQPYTILLHYTFTIFHPNELTSNLQFKCEQKSDIVHFYTIDFNVVCYTYNIRHTLYNAYLYIICNMHILYVITQTDFDT